MRGHFIANGLSWQAGCVAGAELGEIPGSAAPCTAPDWAAAVQAAAAWVAVGRGEALSAAVAAAHCCCRCSFAPTAPPGQRSCLGAFERRREPVGRDAGSARAAISVGFRPPHGKPLLPGSRCHAHTRSLTSHAHQLPLSSRGPWDKPGAHCRPCNPQCLAATNGATEGVVRAGAIGRWCAPRASQRPFRCPLLSSVPPSELCP